MAEIICTRHTTPEKTYLRLNSQLWQRGRMLEQIEKSQIDHYSALHQQHEDSPQSVGWNSRATQDLRFAAMAQLFQHEPGSEYSVHEIGCGLGHFGQFLEPRGCTYSGSDINPEFIQRCTDRFPNCAFTLHSIAQQPFPSTMQYYDYYCLNGTFHTIGENTAEGWQAFVESSIRNMWSLARKGICFSFLSDCIDYRDPKLYYRSPSESFQWATQNLSRFVSIQHALPLYDYFVYVYKPEWIAEVYPELAERYL